MKEIQLTKGKTVLVDDKDYENLMKYKWHAVNGKYAARSVWDGNARKKTMVLMHREIMNNPEGMDVDHIDLNTFDNRKCNLRVVTHQQNCYNRPSLGGLSKYKGVIRVFNGTWAARINVGGEGVNLGTYKTEEEAAKAYNVAAVELVGETAMLNDVNHEGFVIKKHNKSSKYIGVSWKNESKKWVVHITLYGRKVFLGSFKFARRCLHVQLLGERHSRRICEAKRN